MSIRIERVLWCAECGTEDATEYVVTAETEVCVRCWRALDSYGE